MKLEKVIGEVGTIIEKSCPKCGYIKIFQEGFGIQSRNLGFISKVFSGEELAAFSKKLDEGNVENYQLVARTGYCENCRVIEATNVLCYTDVAGREFEIQKGCSECKKPVSFSEKASICPRCSKILQQKEIGYWD